MMNIDGLSLKKLEKIQKVVGIVLDEMEFPEKSAFSTLGIKRILLSSFEQENINGDEAKEILNNIDCVEVEEFNKEWDIEFACDNFNRKESDLNSNLHLSPHNFIEIESTKKLNNYIYLKIVKLYKSKPKSYCLREFKNTLDKKINLTNSTQKTDEDAENSKTTYESGILFFHGKEMDFNKKENQKELLNTLFKKPKKDWFYDEIQEKWDNNWDGAKSNNPESKNYWRKFYNAGNDINTAIAKKTTTEDFIIKNTGTGGWIKINPKYV